MEIDRMELADLAESIKIASAIHRQIGEVPLPVPVEEIATAVGISDIQEVATDGFEGALIANAEKSEGVILINERSKWRRRRFTIGHELGHFLNPWHKPMDGLRSECRASDMRSTRSSTLGRARKMEVEANEFSAELLMPEARLHRDIKRRAGADLGHILDLAVAHEVSKEVAARRYVEVHDEICAVIFSKDGRVRYPYRARAFPWLDVRAEMPLPPQSLSARFDGLLGQPSEWAEVDVALWLSNSKNALLYEQTLRQQNGFQITLLTIETDDEAEAEAEEDLVESWTPKFRR